MLILGYGDWIISRSDRIKSFNKYINDNFMIVNNEGISIIMDRVFPENNKHPKYVLDVSQSLINGHLEGHNYSIVTDSEHIMLRILRRIREGVLKKEDVVVVYHRKGDSFTETRIEDGVVYIEPCGPFITLHIEDDGEFIDDWPGGFFNERLGELM